VSSSLQNYALCKEAEDYPLLQQGKGKELGSTQ